jgi:D-arabinose 1-dehydrogenase-like Zn-dependent alcohol dehydrogenase
MQLERSFIGSVDLVLEFSGFPSAMQSTLNILGIGGVAIWVGATFPQSSISVNAEKIIRKLITIKGIHNYKEADFIAATEFFEAVYATYDFDSLVHGGFSLEQTNEAYQYALKENPYRVGIDLTI